MRTRIGRPSPSPTVLRGPDKDHVMYWCGSGTRRGERVSVFSLLRRGAGARAGCELCHGEWGSRDGRCERVGGVVSELMEEGAATSSVPTGTDFPTKRYTHHVGQAELAQQKQQEGSSEDDGDGVKVDANGYAQPDADDAYTADMENREVADGPDFGLLLQVGAGESLHGSYHGQRSASEPREHGSYDGRATWRSGSVSGARHGDVDSHGQDAGRRTGAGAGAGARRSSMVGRARVGRPWSVVPESMIEEQNSGMRGAGGHHEGRKKTWSRLQRERLEKATTNIINF